MARGFLRMIGAAAITALVAAGLSGPAAAGGLTFAHAFPEDSPINEWARNFSRCAEETAGLFVEVYPAGALGRSAELSERLMFEQVDMAIIPASALERFFPEIAALSSPGLVENPVALAEISQEPDLLASVGRALRGKVRLHLIEIGWWPAVLIGNDAIADLKGAKIRSSGLTARALETFGASTVAMPMSEVFLSLQFGSTDGAVVDLDTAEQMVSEGAVNSMLLSEDFSPFSIPLLLLMNENAVATFGQKLPDMLRFECARVAAEYNFRQTDRLMRLMDEASARGISIIPPDRIGLDAWRDGFELSWSRTGSGGDEIREIFRKFAPAR